MIDVNSGAFYIVVSVFLLAMLLAFSPDSSKVTWLHLAAFYSSTLVSADPTYWWACWALDWSLMALVWFANESRRRA